ncbi:MAG: 4Fe-4S binding protein [Ignisphaera sp.]|nr:4Fe-4S binding protein [Ignisphaera sp.]MDW8085383.1 4Fe-4S binding protein [Ignisphaera sp.]
MCTARIAFISLTGCEGCLYNIVSEELFSLVERYGAKVFHWRLIGARGEEDFDIAVVEGSITGAEDAERLREIRGRSKVLIALGSCSLMGGVQSGVLNEFGVPRSRPLNHYVRVDYWARGCPVNLGEFMVLLERLLRGEVPKIGEKRFEVVERPLIVVTDSDGFLTLDSSKCIVCGRCIEVCRRVGAYVLNYTHRGVLTMISTPYQEALDKAGCIYCGLCTAYCPVGAVYFRMEPEKVRSHSGSPVYIELESLASIAEAENIEPGQVVTALRELGFSEVVVISNLHYAEPGRIYARSPAEYTVSSRFLPKISIELLTPRIPNNALYVTQCIAWRRHLPNSVTSRELQLVLRTMPLGILGSGEPDQTIYSSTSSVKRVRSNIELKEELSMGSSSRSVVFELCPGGCLMGGGQPASNKNMWQRVLRSRENMLEYCLQRLNTVSNLAIDSKSVS